MSSLLAKWHPVTHDFGLIHAPIEQMLSTFRALHASIGMEYVRTDITSSLANAFESLLPLANSKMRRLFVQTHSEWVACFQNGIQGSDPFPAMSTLSVQMGVLAMRVCSTPNGARYPATMWEVYAPESLGGQPPLGYRRSIAAANDGGHWVFDDSGERFPFEQVQRYSEKRKRDRFTRDMLQEYLRHFGVELFSDVFLRIDAGVPAVRLQQSTKTYHMPEYSLEEVVAGLPWKRDPGNAAQTSSS